MKCVIVINSKINSMNLQLSQLYCEGLVRADVECVIIDMSDDSLKEHEKFYTIQREMPDFIITFDMAGFECKNGMGYVSLNSIPCRMAHVITRDIGPNSISKDEIFNYSMYFVLKDERNIEILKNNESIKHIIINTEISDCNKVSKNLELIWKELEFDIDYPDIAMSNM